MDPFLQIRRNLSKFIFKNITHKNCRLTLFAILILFLLIRSHSSAFGQGSAGDRLIYAMRGNVYTYSPDTGELEQITTTGDFYNFAVSSNGEWVYSTFGEWSTLELINIQSGHHVQLTSFADRRLRRSVDIEISPDGTLIAYSGISDQNLEYFVVEEIGGEIIREAQFLASALHWSFDSHNLYYYQEKWNDSDPDLIWEINRYSLVDNSDTVIYHFDSDQRSSIVRGSVIYQKESDVFAITNVSGGNRGPTIEEVNFFSLKGGLDIGPSSLETNLYWSPNGLDYVVGNRGNILVGHIDADRSLNYTELIDAPENIILEGWSPDGRMIAFRTCNDGYGYFLFSSETADFYKYSENLLGIRMVVEGEGDPTSWPFCGSRSHLLFTGSSPWSPSGSWFVVRGLRLVNMITGEQKEIPEAHSSPIINIRWLPNDNSQIRSEEGIPPTEDRSNILDNRTSLTGESWIAVVGEDHNIWLINPDQTEQKQITFDSIPGGSIFYTRPKWSPDGSLLAFLKEERGQGKDWKRSLILFDLSDLSLHSLINEGVALGFDWSPDNGWIVYDRTFIGDYPMGPGPIIDTAYGLWKINVKTLETMELVPRKDIYPLLDPRWSPDGSHLFFKEWWSESIMAVADLEDPQNYHNLEFGTNCDWSPDGGTLVCPEKDPGGGFTAIGCNDIPSSARVINPLGEVLSVVPGLEYNCDMVAHWSPDGAKIAIEKLKWKPYKPDQYTGRFTQAGYFTDLLFLGNHVERIEIGEFSFKTWSSDGNSLLISDYDRNTYLYEISSLKLIPFISIFEASWQPSTLQEEINESGFSSSGNEPSVENSCGTWNSELNSIENGNPRIVITEKYQELTGKCRAYVELENQTDEGFGVNGITYELINDPFNASVEWEPHLHWVPEANFLSPVIPIDIVISPNSVNDAASVRIIGEYGRSSMNFDAGLLFFRSFLGLVGTASGVDAVCVVPIEDIAFLGAQFGYSLDRIMAYLTSGLANLLLNGRSGLNLQSGLQLALHEWDQVWEKGVDIYNGWVESTLVGCSTDLYSMGVDIDSHKLEFFWNILMNIASGIDQEIFTNGTQPVEYRFWYQPPIQ